jgi:nitrite reductase/ring-hydroxylating ferredoxin subunit
VGQSTGEIEVGVVGDVAPGTTRKFVLPTPGEATEAFLVNVAGTLHAWVNRCRHVALTMDWVDNRLLDEAGELIVCATHGARYRPDTGECISGPPVGKTLIRVPLRIENGRIIAVIPAELLPPSEKR